MKSTLLALLLAAAAIAGTAGAQAAPPSTDIFLAPLTIRGDEIVVGTAVNTTQRPGYDNQPAFLPDGSGFLFTSIRDDAQADIWRYDLASRRSTRVTSTPESEYSATPIAGGTAFSAVRVERDSTQRLWRFPLSGGEPALVLEGTKPVGYHAWMGDSSVAVFVVGKSPTLLVAALGQGSGTTSARDIGRGLARVPGQRAVVFVQKRPDGDRLVELAFLPGEFRTRTLIRTLPNQEFFAFLPDGRLLSASTDGVLHAWNGECADRARWIRVGSLGNIRNVSRQAVSPDGKWLAVVAEGN
ncbi:MAG: hypothetical protein ACYC4J_10245 [Gemmatimonadaceae bacterium]